MDLSVIGGDLFSPFKQINSSRFEAFVNRKKIQILLYLILISRLNFKIGIFIYHGDSWSLAIWVMQKIWKEI
jgi:hypothetical protein